MVLVWKCEPSDQTAHATRKLGSQDVILRALEHHQRQLEAPTHRTINASSISLTTERPEFYWHGVFEVFRNIVTHHLSRFPSATSLERRAGTTALVCICCLEEYTRELFSLISANESYISLEHDIDRQ
jgi:hypothetical protein